MKKTKNYIVRCQNEDERNDLRRLAHKGAAIADIRISTFLVKLLKKFEKEK